MTGYSRGDIVLVTFAYTDGTKSKQRPALIISSDDYHDSRQEAVFLAVTSNTERLLFGDYLINKWKEAGLLYPSVVTGIFRTIKQDTIIKKIGTITETDMTAIETNLKNSLSL